MKQSLHITGSSLCKRFVLLMVVCAVLTIAPLGYGQDNAQNFIFNGKNGINNNAKAGKAPAPFTAELSRKLADGIEVTAAGSQYPIKLIPITMTQGVGIRKGNSITYAIAPGVHIIYTNKNNGIKEDIVFDNLSAAPSELAFRLELDPMLEARLDKKGNILIYGPNSVLSGFIQTGDEKSAELILKARRNAPKDNLLYIIPAPVVIDGIGIKHKNIAHYELEKSILTLHSGTIAELRAPVSIDPSIVVTTTADFKMGNNEGMISFDTDAISRAVPSGGAIGAWGSTSSFTTARSAHATVAYNGYLYVIGGWDGTNTLDDIQFAPINSNGTIGTWTATTSLFPYPVESHAAVAYNGYLYVICGNISGVPSQMIRYTRINADGTLDSSWGMTTGPAYPRYGHAAVAYNGYLYIIGGYSDITPYYLNNIEYAPIHADGSLGTFTYTTSFTTARSNHTSVAYNGYLYVLGGWDGTSYFNDVQYAPINADGTIGAWLNANSFTTGREYHSSVACNGYLYVMGGYSGSTGLNDVQYALINTNGSLGSWTATTSFTTARWDQTSIFYNGYLYVIGGYNGSVLNDVQYAPIKADPMVDSWAVTTSFTTARYAHTSVAYNGYLYVLGGYTGTTYLNDVQFAPINADGTVGSWTATTSFPTPRELHTSVAYNGYLYVIGGYNGSYFNAVQFAPINPNGTLGAWAATTSFTTARGSHTSAVYNGYLYVIGGINGSYLNDVQFAPINANGTVGSWNATTSFSIARSGHTSVVYNDYLYVIGGWSGSSTFYNDVQFAPINSNGAIGTWTTTTSFTTARDSHTSVAYNGYLYVMGGYNGSIDLNDVQFAPINANGTVGTWTASTSFTTARGSHTSVVYNGYLYVIGGWNGLNHFSDVQFASANANGTVGTWTATTGFITARDSHTSVAYNGYLYVIGGYSSGYFNDVQFAPINADGTVGTWTTTTSFPTARSSHTSVVYNGYLYVIGGNAGPYLNDVQYAPINADGTVGIWTATTSFATARVGHTSVAYNGYLYVIGGYSSGYLNDVQFAPINADGTVGSWTTTTSFTTARGSHTSVVYNAYLYVIGGYSSGYLNDVQYAPLNANGTIGTWTATASFIMARDNHTSVAYNAYLYVIGGYSSGYLNDVQYAPLNANGTIGTWTATTSFIMARDNHTSVAYNGYLYVIGGYSSSPLNDVQYASMIGPAAHGHYSKLIDIGSNQLLDSISFSSIATNGVTNLAYALAPSPSAVLGTRTIVLNAASGTTYTTGLGCGRYAWVLFDMDDTLSATIDGHGLNGRKDVLDFTLNYTTINLTASAAVTGLNQITVSWTAAAGTPCYNIYRSIGAACPGGTFDEIANCVTGTNYVDSTVSGGTTYSYKVTAEYSGSCESDFSNCTQATATGNCTLAPTFAGMVSATNNNSSTCQINLGWADATSGCPGGPNITYHIYRSTDPAFVPAASNRIAQCITGTTYSDTNVTFGTTYYYVVRAEDTTTTGTGPCNGGNEDANIVKKNAAPSITTISFSDGFETGTGNWTISALWTQSNTYAHTGTYSAWSANLNNRACDRMTKTMLVAIPAGAINARLYFWARYNIQAGYDAGIVQGSTNGSTWTKLTVSPAYPGTTNTSAQACLGTNPQPAFTGTSSVWTEYTVNLAAYAGGNFTVRFNYATDNSIGAGGWYIDDVSIDYQMSCTTSTPPGWVLNTLRLAKSGTNVVLNWTAPGGSCTVTGYGVYRGSLPWTGYNHASLSCSVSGTTSTDTNPTSSYYYLVAPSNSSNEGSYGADSAGTQRPQGSSPCSTQNLASCN